MKKTLIKGIVFIKACTENEINFSYSLIVNYSKNSLFNLINAIYQIENNIKCDFLFYYMANIARNIILYFYSKLNIFNQAIKLFKAIIAFIQLYNRFNKSRVRY